MRGTLTNQDLSEVSEQECHDTTFCYKSPPVALIVNASSEEVCIQEKCSAHAALADLPIDEREQLLFLFWIHVLHEYAAQLGIGVLPSLTLVRGPFRQRCFAHAFKLSYCG